MALKRHSSSLFDEEHQPVSTGWMPFCCLTNRLPIDNLCPRTINSSFWIWQIFFYTHLYLIFQVFEISPWYLTRENQKMYKWPFNNTRLYWQSNTESSQRTFSTNKARVCLFACLCACLVNSQSTSINWLNSEYPLCTWAGPRPKWNLIFGPPPPVCAHTFWHTANKSGTTSNHQERKVWGIDCLPLTRSSSGTDVFRWVGARQN